jgi:N-hydroxyarylamine O-acetyltransferase
MSFDLDAYLQRIGLAEPCPPTAEGLRRLQRAQLRSIAFECIDPFLGKVPDLHPDALWEKLVLSARGGYCFELNSLFGQALAAQGFDASPIMCRVRTTLPEGGARSHLAWVVGIDGAEWLSDCGFGGPCPPEPVLIEHGTEQVLGQARYRICPLGREELLERESDGNWRPLYSFERVTVIQADLEAANFVSARWENAPFSNNLMLSIFRDEGRLTVLNSVVRSETDGGRQASNIASHEELAELLEGPFALKLAPETVTRIWRRLEAQRSDRPETE